MLSEIRMNLGLTQEEMASDLNISKSYYQKIENGERSPSFDFLRKFKKKHPMQSVDAIFFDD